jgi:DNA-binding CsgD family transcriptional regulator
VLAVIEFYGDRGRYEIDDSVLRSMMGMGYELGEFLSHRRWELSPGALTPREHEILQIAAAEGLRTREIADRLVLSPATVTTHFNNIYEKFEVSDRASAVAHAFRAGLIA